MKCLNYNNIFKLSLAYLFFISVVIPASATDDIQVVTNLSVDVNSFDIEVDETFSGSGNPTWDGSTESRKINGQSASSTIGVNVISGKFSYGITALITGAEPSSIDGAMTRPTGSTIKNSVDATVSRTSYSYLVGYRLDDAWNVYAGYTLSSTQLGNTFTFLDEGVFLGAKYIVRTGASTSLIFNGAYSLTKTSIELKNNSLLGDYQIEGNSDAVSLGATWLYSLDRGRSFYLRLKYSFLDFKESKNGVSPADGTMGDVSLNASQKYTTFSLGMGF